MDACIIGQLGMKRGCQQVALAHSDNLILKCGDDLHTRPGTCNVGRPDKDTAHIPLLAMAQVERDAGLEAINLAAKRISRDCDIHKFERRLIGISFDISREQYHTGACAINRHSGRRTLSNWRQKLNARKQLRDGGALSAGQYERMHAGQVAGRSYLRGLHEKAIFQYSPVGLVVTLQRKNSYGQLCWGRMIHVSYFTTGRCAHAVSLMRGSRTIGLVVACMVSDMLYSNRFAATVFDVPLHLHYPKTLEEIPLD
jgi:hypothetical protein